MSYYCSKKVILVLHILSDDDQPLKVTKKYCDVYNQNLEYELIYISVSDDDLESVRTVIEESFGFCTNVLIRILGLNEQIESFLESLKSKMFQTALYSESFEGIPNNFFDINNPEILKIYNLIENEQSSDFKKIVKNNVSYLSVPENTFQKDFKNNTLECQSWFKHFIYKAFNCVSGRLLQLSGTCYLNTAINGLFLSKGLQLLLKNIYSKETEKDFVPLSSLSCPVEQTKSSKKYIMNLIYNILINKEKVQDTSSDVLIQASKHIFSSYESGEGGNSMLAFVQILLSLQIPFVLKLPHSYTYHNFFSPLQINNSPEMFVHPEHIDKTLYKKIGFRNYFQQLPQTTKISQADIIIDLQEIRVEFSNCRTLMFPLEDAFLSTEKEFDNIPFVIQFAFIAIDFEKGPGHAVVGIFCDQKQRIFDSNNNFYDVDWKYFTKENINRDHILRDKLRDIYGIPPTSITREAVVYLRKEKFEELYELK